MKIAVIGTGYVGLVTGVSLAAAGNEVVCIGRDPSKAEQINSSHSPFYEPGLDSLLKKVLKEKTFFASIELDKYVKWSDIILIAVGTPTVNNKIDLSAIETVSKQIGEAIKDSKKYHVVVVKSTVLPGVTEDTVEPLVKKYSKKTDKDFGLCMNPEFLREGCAVEDGMNPDRVVIGCRDEKSGKQLAKVYKMFSCPILHVSVRTAEMTKYAANALFATLISYSNEISRITEKIGNVDVVDVWRGVHLDKRLSPQVDSIKPKDGRIVPGVVSYIYSGCGYGGSCFPKDTKAIASFAKEIGEPAGIIDNVIKINKTQPDRIVTMLERAFTSLKGKRIAILGLAFKPDTDDLRESPSIELIKSLNQKDVKIIAHDVQAYKSHIPKELTSLDITLAGSIDETIKNADAVIVMTAWNEYKTLKPALFVKHMKKPFIIDGRRILDRQTFTKAGVTYAGIGYYKN